MVEKGNKRTSSSSSGGNTNGGASPSTAAAAAAGCPAHAEKKSKPSTAAAAAGGCPHLAGSDYRKGRMDGPLRCTWCVVGVGWVCDWGVIEWRHGPLECGVMHAMGPAVQTTPS